MNVKRNIKLNFIYSKLENRIHKPPAFEHAFDWIIYAPTFQETSL